MKEIQNPDLVRRLNDRELVHAVAQRNPDALAELFRRHSTPVYALARRLCDDATASSIAQEVFLALWNAPFDIGSIEFTARTPLLIETHRRCAALRKQRPSQWSQESRDTLYEELEQEIAAHRPPNDQVWNVFRSLPPLQRQALMFAYFGGLSAKEIAEIADRQVRDVHSDIAAGMKSLRRATSDA